MINQIDEALLLKFYEYLYFITSLERRLAGYWNKPLIVLGADHCTKCPSKRYIFFLFLRGVGRKTSKKRQAQSSQQENQKKRSKWCHDISSKKESKSLDKYLCFDMYDRKAR